MTPIHDETDKLALANTASYLSEMKKKRNKRKLILFSLVLTCIIYTIGWFYIAVKIEDKARRELAQIMAQQPATRCENLHMEGFPFRFDIVCESISFSRPDDSISIQAGHLVSGFPVYAPYSLSHYLTGPALVEWPEIVPLELNWSSLQSNTRLTRPVPDRIKLEGQDVAIGLRREPTYSEPFADISELAFSFALEENAIHANGRFAGLTFIKKAFNTQTVPEIDGIADIVIYDAASLMSEKSAPLAERLRGHAGEIKQFLITTNNGAMISLSGPLSFDEEGRASGKLSVRLIEPALLAQTAQNYVPEQGSNISALLFALTAVAGETDGNITLTVDIDKGRIRAGFIPLGRLPAL